MKPLLYIVIYYIIKMWLKNLLKSNINKSEYFNKWEGIIYESRMSYFFCMFTVSSL